MSHRPLARLAPAAAAVAAAMLISGVIATPARANDDNIKPGAPHSLAANIEMTTDQFIVEMKEKAGPAATAANDAAQSAAARTGLKASRIKQSNSGAQIIKVNRRLASKDAETFVAALRADLDVERAEPDAIMQPMAADPNDNLYPLQWDLWEDRAGLRVPAAWDVSRGEGVVVAVVDTGILPHSELNDNVLPGYDMMSDASSARDGDARDADPTDEGDWVAAGQCNGSNPSSVSSWHGTHVAGTIAAIGDNGVGVTGVAPAAKILPIRALGPCGGYTSDIADSIVWAAGGSVAGAPINPNPAQIINLSLGGISACSATYQNAINIAYNLGAAVVVAAGNSNRPAADSSPANCQNVITVAASSRSGARAPYSNFGPAVDVTAPGGDMSSDVYSGVLSTSNFGSTVAADEAYEFQQGTSMAAPHVAGVAALIRSEVGKAATPALIEERLKATARPLYWGCSGGCGAGLVDAASALALHLDTQTTAGVPTIAGLPSVGHMLKSSTGSWSPEGLNFTYQWQRSGVDIPGATGADYAVEADDLGGALSVVVTGSRFLMGSVSAASSPTSKVIESVIDGPWPVITERPGYGSTVFYTVDAGIWEPAPVALTYQWKRSGQDIWGATGTTYMKTFGDWGHEITVQVTGSKSGYQPVQKTVSTRQPGPPIVGVEDPNPIVVTPAPVIFDDHDGTAADSYEIPSSFGVNYVQNGAAIDPGVYPAAGNVVVNAVPQIGYVLADGAVAEWSHEFKATPYEVTPRAVTFVDEDGTSKDTFTIPAVEGVEYLVGDAVKAAGTYAGSGTLTVKARALTDYILTDGATAQWSHEFKATPYPVTPAAVSFADKPGTSDDTYTVPATDGVEYLVGDKVQAAGTYAGSGTVTVKARATTDYIIAPGAVTEWAQTFSAKHPAVPGSMIPVTPFRAVDTRNSAAVRPDGTISFQVAGVGGVPAGVSAVVFNLTVADAKSFGFVTAYASGTSRPDASNLNFDKGQIVANSVTVPVGADGKVTLFNRSAGATQLLADVSGYYLPGTPTAAGAFASVAPQRFLDTRSGAAVGADKTVSFQVAGAKGIPSGVSAVVMNLTVAEAKSFGFITAYPSGTSRPNASNVNFDAGQIIPNAVTVPVGADGKVTLYNRSNGATHLLADVSGYYLAGTPVAEGTFQAVAPTRFLDTRSSAPARADSAVSFQVGGANGIPADASAVVFNLTVADASSFGFVTAHASGTNRPNASNVNFDARQIVPNLVVSPVGRDGKVSLFNRSSGATHLLADVSGYFLAG